jgi:hypothetical protein
MCFNPPIEVVSYLPPHRRKNLPSPRSRHQTVEQPLPPLDHLRQSAYIGTRQLEYQWRSFGYGKLGSEP